jgi:hypothetical protein
MTNPSFMLLAEGRCSISSSCGVEDIGKCHKSSDVEALLMTSTKHEKQSMKLCWMDPGIYVYICTYTYSCIHMYINIYLCICVYMGVGRLPELGRNL